MILHDIHDDRGLHVKTTTKIGVTTLRTAVESLEYAPSIVAAMPWIRMYARARTPAAAAFLTGQITCAVPFTDISGKWFLPRL